MKAKKALLAFILLGILVATVITSCIKTQESTSSQRDESDVIDITGDLQEIENLLNENDELISEEDLELIS